MLTTNFTPAPPDHNGSFTQEKDTQLELTFLILKSAIIITIIIFSIVNNVLVIIAVIINRRLRHINNYFLVSLAFADLFVALFAMTFKATVEITGRWNFSFFMCDFWNSMDVHASTVSTLHLCCISVDRYYAIARPLQYHMVITVRVACGMIALAWLLPTAISFLPIFLGWYTTTEFLEEKENHPDECLFVVNKPYAFLSSSLTFWLPVLVMLCLYHRIYKEAKRHRAAIRRHSIPMVCHNTLVIPSACAMGVVTPSSYSLNIMIAGVTNGRLGDRPGQPNYVTDSGRRPSTASSSLVQTTHTSESQGTRRSSFAERREGSPPPSPWPVRRAAPHSSSRDGTQTSHRTRDPGHRTAARFPTAAERRAVRSANWRKEHKAFVTLGLVMGAFLLCWLPFFIWYLVSTICGPSCPPSPDIVVAILFWTGYFNSTLNPIIYVMTNHEFKEAFTSILRRACCLGTKQPRAEAYTFSQSHSTRAPSHQLSEL